ncbi:protein of unknown function [Candidatus Filomicrobium marinum]|uniref:Protein kinase domain-containing protein n=1 Tax=Candidatus Filomicrobium marinum TaxID=1608628 RepID=A0A0D6JBL2_9HYPH|nr:MULTISPECIES: hypothetical protein [Filomicrobium]MCV0371821.1 hypothetical protein [Filomicrobium sp.]CFX05543.1 protein of unknown function [Candidatus Filomicrobium marinum]CPR16261.1 protein of unknown function [Candidatus Filomicrobium marinum]
METVYWGCRVQPHGDDIWTQYEIDKPLANASGGEGGIFTLKPHAGETRVAKIYNHKSKSLLKSDAFRSLAILTSRYQELSQPNALPFVAWPIEVLFTIKHPSTVQHLSTLAGITMRHVTGHNVLRKLTSDAGGRIGNGNGTQNGLANAKAVRIAAIIAHYLNRMHQRGIVFCDLNPNNILVSNDYRQITFVDADAFQHPFVTAFTKPHFTDGYASPNQANKIAGPRTPDDDNFVLAIHIFQLLLDGGHPFDTGPAFNPTGDFFANITPNDNIKARRWPYSDVAKFRPPGETPAHYARLHPDLRSMFARAFQDFVPPTAKEWEETLPSFANTVEANSPPKPKASPPPRPQAPPAPAQQYVLHPRPASPVNLQATPSHVPRKPIHIIVLAFIAKCLRSLLIMTGMLLGRLALGLAKWLAQGFADIATAAWTPFKKYGGVEITAGLVLLGSIFWLLDAYERHLIEKRRPHASSPALFSLAPAMPAVPTPPLPEPKTYPPLHTFIPSAKPFPSDPRMEPTPPLFPAD